MAENTTTKPLDHRIALWIYSHIKILSIIFGILFFIIIFFILFTEFQKKQSHKIYSELYQMRQFLDIATKKENKDMKDSSFNQITQLLNKTKTPMKVSEEMVKKAHSYRLLIEKYKHTEAGAVSASYLANFYYKSKKTNQAIALLELFSSDSKTSDIYNLLSFQLSSYYMSQKECNKALLVLDKIIQSKKTKYLHEEAYLQMGICYEHLENFVKAKELYKMIITNFNSNYSFSAKNYLKILKLKENIKKSSSK